MKNFKITMNAPVTIGFAGICFVVLVLNFITAGKSNQLLFMTYRSSLANPLTYVRLFTHVFGHSGWQHFIGNMGYILLLGPMLEEKYGERNIIMVIAIVALATGLINFLFFKNVALCGASGVVFAFILLTSFTSFKSGEIPITVVLVAVIFLGQQILEGLFVQNNVSNLSHIIGGIIGALAGYSLNIRS